MFSFQTNLRVSLIIQSGYLRQLTDIYVPRLSSVSLGSSLVWGERGDPSLGIIVWGEVMSDCHRRGGFSLLTAVTQNLASVSVRSLSFPQM